MSSSTYATLPTSSTHLASQLLKYGLPHWDLNKPDVDIKPAADSLSDVENNPEVDIKLDVEINPEVGIKPAADSKPDVKNHPEVHIQTDVDSKPKVDMQSAEALSSKYAPPPWDSWELHIEIDMEIKDVENNPEGDIQPDMENNPEGDIQTDVDIKPYVENNPEVGIQTDVDSKPPVDYEIHRFFREAELTLLKTYRKPTGAKDTEKEKPAKPGGNWQYNKIYNRWFQRVSGKKSTAKRKEKRAADPEVQKKKQARSASSAN